MNAPYFIVKAENKKDDPFANAVEQFINTSDQVQKYEAEIIIAWSNLILYGTTHPTLYR